MRIDQIRGAVYVQALSQDLANSNGRLFDGPILGHIVAGVGRRRLIIAIEASDEVDLAPADFNQLSCALAFTRGFGLSHELASSGRSDEAIKDVRRLAKWLEWSVYEFR